MYIHSAKKKNTMGKNYGKLWEIREFENKCWKELQISQDLFLVFFSPTYKTVFKSLKCNKTLRVLLRSLKKQ